MKVFFIAGTVLMATAAIYGFADYAITSKDPAFQSLYQEQKEIVPVATDRRDETIHPETKQAEQKKISEAAVMVNPDTTGEPVIDKKEVATPLRVAKKKSIKKRTRKNYELFSRAAPPQRFFPADSVSR